ncbi:phosphatidate cytidylyltransferase [Chthonobacter rhizosphaerae]|uniref:phosphatidate cytidylyltransferase n=1 Tax=Chthonobacter rhizosphaerae TaxID=2735553 RepID=UPI0015EF3A9C|nr:phosphatidate cytidylyltransferase [Chthonobacter rhizosphaerae]
MSAGQPEEPRRPRSDLPLRLASALVMMAIAAGAVVAGGYVFAGLVAIGAGLVLHEWNAMAGPFQTRAADKASLVLVAVSVFASIWDPVSSIAAIAAVTGVLVLLGAMDRKLPWLGAGIVYAALPGVAAIVLRGNGAPGETTNGLVALAFVFVVVWAADSAAYFVGRSVGGPKLWPRVSPKKTWSGALGGLVGAVAGGLAVAEIGGFRASAVLAVVILVLAVGSQAGDLFESALKRHFGVKDSSHLIPGHGGVMDRVDGLAVALVLAAAIGMARAGGADVATGLMAW